MKTCAKNNVERRLLGHGRRLLGAMVAVIAAVALIASPAEAAAAKKRVKPFAAKDKAVDPAAEVEKKAEKVKAAEPDENKKFYKIPPRKLDAWGMVVRGQVKLADGLAGGVRVTLPAGAEGISVKENAERTVVQFSCKRAGKPEVIVVALEVKDGLLNWEWKGFSPQGIDMGKLDVLLRGMAIEAKTKAGAAVTFQAEPGEVEVKIGGGAGGVRIGELTKEMELQSGKTGADWAASLSDGKLVYSYQETPVFSLSLDAEKKMLKVEPEVAKKGRLVEIEKELKDLQTEKARLQARKKSATVVRRAYGPVFQPNDTTLDNQIETADKSIKELEKEKADLVKQAGSGKQADPAGCEAELVLPGGTVVCRIKIKR